MRWLWSSRRIDARLTRTALLPLAWLWQGGMTTRAALYRWGWRRGRRPPLPSIAVGNLTVGGTGKTPVASWIAGWYAARGIVPGIVLRGYGDDEARLHRQAVPAAHVVVNPDRVAGASAAAALGAAVVVFDDAYQRLDLQRDYNIVLMSADGAALAPWPLPAGPWRERWGALDRADAVIVTRKSVSAETAGRLAAELRRRVSVPVMRAHLALRRFEGLVSGRPYLAESLRRARVVAASAIGDPAAFEAQLRALGAEVVPAAWRDHHPFDDGDLAWLAETARTARLVVTCKDAVKLKDRWPASAPEPLVAQLDLEWEEGGDTIVAALAGLVPA